jgi:predicted dehydrogenase
VLRGAVIGLGNVAVAAHLPGWASRRDVTIVAAVDPDARRRRCLEGEFAALRWYDDLGQALAREGLDFVDICAPPAFHAGLARPALAAGLHVLCEKPLAIRHADAQDLAALARARDRALHTVHNWLHAAPSRAITAALAEGAVGRVRRIAWQTLRTTPAAAAGDAGNWRTDAAIAGGGILFDHGWHALYCVAGWMGTHPATVAAVLETRRHREWNLEDTATVRLAADGVEAEIFLTWTAEARSNRVEIVGERGRLLLEGEWLAIERAGAPAERRRCAPPLSEGSHHPAWFAGVMESFVAAAGAARPAEASNLADAVLCSALIHAALASSALGGRPVPVPEGAGFPAAGLAGG